MTTSLPRAIACSILLATIALSGGCGAQRPHHIVKRDGDAAYKSGDYAKAQADYGEYVTRKPEAHQLRYDLARAYVADGRARSAIEELTIALDVSPLNDDYLDLQAKAMFEADERDALTTLLRRNASERGRVSDFIRLGEYSAKLGNADEAKEALLTAAKIDGGKTVKPQTALADFYGSVGDRKTQTRRLRMAYFIDPSNESVVQQLIAMGEQPAPGFGLRPEEFPLPEFPSRN
jgi:tetratricopeptide (TPR) repeat protein